MATNKILIVIVMLLIVAIIFQIIQTRMYIKIGIGLAQDAEKYVQKPDYADKLVLMIGDSTVVGTGAAKAEDSLAGLVGKTLPKAEIINKGVNGMKTKQLRSEIEGLSEEYDLIMLHIGGNDIVRFTELKKLENDLHATVKAAKSKSEKVILINGGNPGTALLLPWMSRPFYNHRARQVREIFLRVAEENSIPLADVFREPEVDPFHLEPDTYYASDYFHPGSVGYKLWYERIEPVVVETIK
tara:strand:+ start:27944 stop:28669 length:726 start_codon:yes stop_codon:yes gene_type:complete